MSHRKRSQDDPEFVTPPGFQIREKMQELGVSSTELAGRIGCTEQTFNEVITGQAPIGPELALQLEWVPGIPARFWNNAERQYRDSIARRGEGARMARRTEGRR